MKSYFLRVGDYEAYVARNDEICLVTYSISEGPN
jgi:hypothetical protein